MLLSSRLEGEHKSGGTWRMIFRQSPQVALMVCYLGKY
jgi:hypothetical protein